MWNLRVRGDGPETKPSRRSSAVAYRVIFRKSLAIIVGGFGSGGILDCDTGYSFAPESDSFAPESTVYRGISFSIDQWNISEYRPHRATRAIPA